MDEIKVLWTSSIKGRFVAFVTGVTEPDEAVEEALRGPNGNKLSSWSSEGYVVEGSADRKSGDTPEGMCDRLGWVTGIPVELRIG